MGNVKASKRTVTAAAKRLRELIEEQQAAEREVLLSVGETVREVYERPKTKQAKKWANRTVAELAAVAYGGADEPADEHAQDGGGEHGQEPDAVAQPGQFGTPGDVM